ncbi:MAG: hypothetical protein L0312_11855 [Acidobacteria bacterium]|nr:hypothetical protein [Acidobacteriota bacterium]
MSRICLKALARVMFACFIVAASNFCQPPAGAVEPASDTTLKDLQSLDELRALFNKYKDAPRLILLLSPT